MTRTCSVEGCGRPHQGRGFCKAHWARWRYGDVRPDAPLRGSPGSDWGTARVCPSCGGLKRAAAAVCRSCYERSRKVRRLCTVQGCGRARELHSMCLAHYRRWSRTGDARAGIPVGAREAHYRDPAERLWRYVDRSGECWEWTRALSGGGYGRLRVKSRYVPVHRLSWELANGPIPDGLWVCHRCDNRRCVRPEHLFLGTPSDNAVDMIAKHRDRWSLRGPSPAEVQRPKLISTRVDLGRPDQDFPDELGWLEMTGGDDG